jgi:hypothetical protein
MFSLNEMIVDELYMIYSRVVDMCLEESRFTLGTILGMRGSAWEVSSRICHLEKKYFLNNKTPS